MSRAEARHRFVEHTGELEIHVRAADLAGLLEQAARALAEVVAEDSAGAPEGEPERVTLTAADREALLVDWLNELVYRGEIEKRVFSEVHVEHATPRRIEATIRGHTPGAPKTAVKAATWHRVRVRETSEGLEATVVLDV